MDTINVLHKFCDHDYAELSAPWSFESYSFASDGSIAIRVPRVLGVYRDPPCSAASELQFSPGVDGEWVDIPAYELPPKIICACCRGTGKQHECPECDGGGVVAFSTTHNNYKIECKTCHGNGLMAGGDGLCHNCNGDGAEYKEMSAAVPNFGTETYKINAFILDKIKDLPGVKIFSAPTGKMFHFRFDGGDGVAMAMRNE